MLTKTICIGVCWDGEIINWTDSYPKFYYADGVTTPQEYKIVKVEAKLNIAVHESLTTEKAMEIYNASYRSTS